MAEIHESRSVAEENMEPSKVRALLVSRLTMAAVLCCNSVKSVFRYSPHAA